MAIRDTMKSVKLDRRIIQTAIDLKVIKNDHKRDAKPWWKYDRLDREIMDIAHEVEQLQTHLAWKVKQSREAVQQLKELTKKVKSKQKKVKSGA